MLFEPPARARRRGRRRAALLRPHAADAREARRRPDRDRRSRPTGSTSTGLEQALADGHRPKLIHVIPNFHNPAGCTLSEAKRRRLVELSAEHGFWIFEDDPYREVRFGGAEPLPTMLSLAEGTDAQGDPRLLVLEDGQPRRPRRLPGRPRRARSGSSPSAPARPTSRRTCWPSRSSSSSAAPAASTRTSSWSTRPSPSAATRVVEQLERADPGGRVRRPRRRLLPLARPRRGHRHARRCCRSPRRRGSASSPAPTSCSRAASAACASRSPACPRRDVPEGIGRIARALEQPARLSAEPPLRACITRNDHLRLHDSLASAKKRAAIVDSCQ